MRISVPSDGCVGGAPTPRNDSVASAMMASASEIVAITSTGESTLGRMWRSMIAPEPRPIRRAACTYSLLRSTSVAPRTTRANCTQSDSPMARISTQIAIWSRCSIGITPRATPKIRSATRIDGKVSCTSATRMMTVSTQPPR